MDGPVKDQPQVTVSEKPQLLTPDFPQNSALSNADAAVATASVADLLANPALAGLPSITLADYDGGRGDGIPRPPYDPLSTGQKMAGLVDAGISIGGGALAISKFQREGLHVLQTDLRSLDSIVHSPELADYRALGSSLKTRVDALSVGAHDGALSLQTAKPHLFENSGSQGIWRGVNLKIPKYAAMEDGEAAVVNRAANLRWISDCLRRGLDTSSPTAFSNGVQVIQGLHNNDTAIAEGLSPELLRLEKLGLTVSDQASEGTLSLISESRGVLLRNTGVIGAGLATNFIIEKTLLKDSSPSVLTMACDAISPFIVTTDLPLWAKFGVIVGAHAAGRLAEYGMAHAGDKDNQASGDLSPGI